MNAVMFHLLFPGAHFVSYDIFLVSSALAMSPGLGLAMGLLTVLLRLFLKVTP